MEGTPRILVIDDDADHRAMVRAILAEHAPDAVVLEAADGDDGLIVRQDVRGPLLILCDQRMPRLSGLSFFQCLEGRRRSDERWVAVSSDVSDDQLALLLRTGVDDVVEKPVAWPDMASILRRVVDEWRVTCHTGLQTAAVAT